MNEMSLALELVMTFHIVRLIQNRFVGRERKYWIIHFFDLKMKFKIFAVFVLVVFICQVVKFEYLKKKSHENHC